MADKVIAASLSLDSSKAETSVKSFKAELRLATNELISITSKFGATSEQAQNAAKKVAEMRAEMKEAKKLADAFNPVEKFNAFGTAVGGVTHGFEALQGTLGLFGQQSEDIEKQLLKVQSVMAFSEGINGLLESKEAFLNFASVIKDKVVTAFSTLKNALISAGIGALVIGIGLLIANFDKLKEALGFANKEQELLNETLDDFKKGAQSAIEKTNEVKVAFDEAKAGVISKEKALRIYNDTLGDTFGKATSLTQAEKLYTDKAGVYIQIMGLKAQANALFAKSAEETAKGITAANEDQISALGKFKDFVLSAAGQSAVAGASNINEQIKGVERVKKLTVENAELLNKTGLELAKQADLLSGKNKIGDKVDKEIADEAKKASDQRIAAEKAAQEQLIKARQEGALLQIKDEELQAKQKAEFDYANSLRSIEALKISEKTKTELIAAETQKRNLAIQKISDDFDKKRDDARTEQESQAFQDEIDANEKFLKLSEESLKEGYTVIQKNLEQSLKAFNEQLAIKKAIDDSKNNEFQVKLDDLEKNYKEKLRIVAGNEQLIAELTAQYERDKTVITQQETETRLSVISTGLGAIADIIGKQTAAGKVLGIATALINTYVGASEVLRAKSVLPEPFGTIAKIANVIAVIATGIKAVKAITSVPVPGGGGGASVPSVSSIAAPLAPQAQVQTTQLDQTSLNNTGNAAVKAFVVESDIANNRDRIARLSRASRLGG